jgi:hypothetical protein
MMLRICFPRGGGTAPCGSRYRLPLLDLQARGVLTQAESLELIEYQLLSPDEIKFLLNRIRNTEKSLDSTRAGRCGGEEYEITLCPY